MNDKLELANRYLDRITDDRPIFNYYPDIFREEMNNIRNALFDIIDNGCEYFLTDAFINYLRTRSYQDILFVLKKLSKDRTERVIAIKLFFEEIEKNYYNKVSNYLFNDLLDEYTKNATLNFHLNNVAGCFYDSEKNSHKEDIMYVLISYCYCEGIIKDYDTIFSKVYDNFESIIVDLSLNALSFGTSTWYNRVIADIERIIKGNNKKTIR